MIQNLNRSLDPSNEQTVRFGTGLGRGKMNPYALAQQKTGLTYGDMGVLEQFKLMRNYAYGAAQNATIDDIDAISLTSPELRSMLGELDDASLVQTMTSMTRAMSFDGTVEAALRASRSPDAGYGRMIRTVTESGGIQNLARVAAGIRNPYASQDLATRAFNTELAKATSSVASSFRAVQGADRYRFMKRADVLSELGMSYFRGIMSPNLLSDIDGAAGSVRGVTRSKILITQGVLDKMMVRYRAEDGTLAEGGLLELMSANPRS